MYSTGYLPTSSFGSSRSIVPVVAMVLVAVGSSNPVKLEAARLAFRAAFGEVEVMGYDVPSSVPAQPYGDVQTRQGALHRAVAALAAHQLANERAAAFGVGMEGGVEEENVASRHPSSPLPLPSSLTHCFAWMAVVSHREGEKSRVGLARSASVALPSRIVALMKGDPPMELGDADDRVFSDLNSKQKGGTVVKLTAGMIDRTEYYVHALKLALAPFLHEASGLYCDCETSPLHRWRFPLRRMVLTCAVVGVLVCFSRNIRPRG